MSPRTALVLAMLAAPPALAADPDAFPVEGAPTIVEVAPDGRVKNRAPGAPDDAATGLGGLKNRDEPADRFRFEALEITAAAEPEANPAPASASPSAHPSDEQAPAAPPADMTPPPAQEPPAPPPAEDAESRRSRSALIWVQDTSDEISDKLSDAWSSLKRKDKDAEADELEVDEVEVENEEVERVEVDTRPLAIPVDDQPRAEPLTEAHAVEHPAAEAEVSTHRRWRYTQHTLVGLRKRSGRFGMYAAGTGVSSGFGHGATSAGGLEAGFLLGGHVVLGGAGYSSSEFALNSGRVAQFVWGGVQVGYIVAPQWLVHPRVDVLIGSGVLLESGTGRPIAEAAVFTPRVGLELNVTRGIRVLGHAGLRKVTAPSDAGRDLSAPELGLTVEVGWL